MDSAALSLVCCVEKARSGCECDIGLFGHVKLGFDKDSFTR